VGRVPRVSVVGSFIMDLVIRAPRRPEPGETLIGREFGMFPGGKGANQASGGGSIGSKGEHDRTPGERQLRRKRS